MIQVTEWHNLYPSQWKGVIIPEAIAHPAKFSSKLIRRIYEHMLEMDWILEGETVIDPFGGVALGALDCMRLGLRWRGCELEPRFVELGNANITHWNKRFASLPKWSGDAVLLQGDSRELVRILGESGQGMISSPPYAETRNAPGGANMNDIRRDYHGDGNYSRVAGAVSSPPYAETAIAKNSTGIDLRKQWETYRASGGGQSFEAFCTTQRKHSHDYGSTPGQLGAMKASVSSPPYEGTLGNRQHEGNQRKYLERQQKYNDLHPEYRRPPATSMTYAGSEGNLSNDSGSDFWLAARAIVEQTYQILAPGAHAIWVVKGFVKAKQYVDFPGQWRQLCEAVGFVALHEHRAMLVHRKGSQHTLEGGLVEYKTESKSFFRRLAEKNGSPRIDFETVYCMEKKRKAKG